MKTCSKCGVLKAEAEFSLMPRGPLKLRNYCKKCRCKEEAERRTTNPEEICRRDRERYLENPEKKRLASRERRRQKPEECRKGVREWRDSHQGYENDRYKNDVVFKIKKLLRGRLRHAMSGHARRDKTVALLGCPWVWAEVHLESLFRPGMMWKNHGPVWHIDHIKPCDSFNLLDPEQQKICFHWTNLQPLFAEENLKKGASV